MLYPQVKIIPIDAFVIGPAACASAFATLTLLLVVCE
jgi:hypothetical protein